MFHSNVVPQRAIVNLFRRNPLTNVFLTHKIKSMPVVELTPDLSSCIETTAKHEYEKASKLLLSAVKKDEELEQRAEILRLFLESMDFKKLRSESERYLLNGRKVKFVIFLESGWLRYEMQVS